MTPVQQSDFDDGTPGDCVRACIASILDMPLCDVPHFLALREDSWRPDLREWLAGRGLEFHMIYASCGGAPEGYAIAFGPVHTAWATDRYHAVVVQDGVLVHDPNGGDGLDATNSWLVITPIEDASDEADSELVRLWRKRRAETRGWNV